MPPSSGVHSAVVHSFSAAAAGAIGTLATHPFDVIKVFSFFTLHLVAFCSTADMDLD